MSELDLKPAHYKRLNILNFVVGFACLTVAVWFVIDTPVFLIIVAFFIFLPFIAGLSGEMRQRIRAKRREVFRAHPSLVWKGLLLNLVLPLSSAIAAFFVFSFEYNNAALVFLGVTSLGAIVTNFYIVKALKLHEAEAFD